MKKYFCLLVLGAALSGCAGYRPVVDMKGVDQAQYEQDLRECQQYAEQVNVAGETATGSAVGAAFGAAVTAVGGGRGTTGAAVGAITGAGVGGSHAASGQRQIINRCMTGRGYRVLR